MHISSVCPSKYLVADFIEEAAAHLVEGFEAARLRRSYPVRLVSLAAKLCRRTYSMVGVKMHSVQVCCENSLLEQFDILENMFIAFMLSVR